MTHTHTFVNNTKKTLHKRTHIDIPQLTSYLSVIDFRHILRGRRCKTLFIYSLTAHSNKMDRTRECTFQ